MKNLLLVLAVLATACGGGSWSNKDLEFINALPVKDDLESKLPRTGTNQSGLGQSKQELGLGTHSAAYDSTTRAGREFNGGLDSLLALIEGVRKTPPTSRGENERTWGPFPDENNPGFDVRVRMTREGEKEFQYFIEFKKQGSEAWFSILDGSFLASSGIRKGVGALVLSGSRARAGGLDGDWPTLDTLEVVYSTEDTVFVSLTMKDTAGTQLVYSYKELSDGRGQMDFNLTNQQAEGGTFLPETYQVASAWLPSGVGRVKFAIVAGDFVGAHYDECWDQKFDTTWWAQSWDGVVQGKESSECQELGALLR